MNISKKSLKAAALTYAGALALLRFVSGAEIQVFSFYSIWLAASLASISICLSLAPSFRIATVVLIALFILLATAFDAGTAVLINKRQFLDGWIRLYPFLIVAQSLLLLIYLAVSRRVR